jgi:DNA-binding phage protein
MAQVARDLAMSRSTLYEAVERLGIDPGQFRR